jgi:anaerobic magnesium-protoporphyrin IX monomethyl ester cyclase
MPCRASLGRRLRPSGSRSGLLPPDTSDTVAIAPMVCCNTAMRIAVVGAELEENLAVRYIRSALVSEGHQVFQVDFNSADETEAAARTLVASAPDIIAMSMVFTSRAREFLALATRARTFGYSGHIIVGGHFAALNHEALLRDAPAIDSVGLGEGEPILCNLACRLNDLDQVPGLVWRAADGRMVRNPTQAQLADFGRWPWPARRWPRDSYLGLPIVNMLGSRGCSHACAFCSIAAWHRFCGGPRHRLREVDDIADEIASLYADGVRIFNFHDDNFLLRHRGARLARILALRDALDSRRVGRIGLAIKARPDEVDLEILTLLQSMGLFRVFLGIEAGTAKSLRALGRGQTIGQNERAVDLVNGLGLHMCFNLLLLNPDSTLEDMAANVSFLHRRPDNPMNFCRTEIYAGTPLERQLRREGRLLGDYFGYDYRIADGRAELACRLTYDLFRVRNYGWDCLHHRVMDVDYESTLLDHFYPQANNARLTAKVKSFVRRANLNTCDYLEEVIAKATMGLDEPSYTQAVEELSRRMRADEARLANEADHLLDQIRTRAARTPLRSIGPERTQPASRSRNVVAAAGLAASIAVAGYVHADGGKMAPAVDPANAKPEAAPPHEPKASSAPSWHMHEMAPARPDPSSQPSQAPPPAPNSGKGKDVSLYDKIVQKLLKTAVRCLRQPGPLQLQVTLDKKGRVAEVEVQSPQENAPQIAAAVRRLSFKAGGPFAGKPFELSFTRDEVRAQLLLLQEKPAKPRRTHNNECIPYRPRPQLPPDY